MAIPATTRTESKQMSTFEPRLVRRIGVVVEMGDGELITIYSDSPTVEMQVETRIETERLYRGADTRLAIVDQTTDITITGIQQLNVSTRATEATAQAIENAKAITEGKK